MKEDNSLAEIVRKFKIFSKDIQKEYPVILQLGKRFGRRLSFLAGETLHEQFLFPPMIFELPENTALSYFGFEKLSQLEKEKVIQKIERFKRMLEKENG